MNGPSYMRRCLAGLAVGGLLAATPAAAEPSLDDILRAVTVTPPSRVCFIEERHNALLREPLVVSGYLEYLGEGRLGKIVLTPFEESLVLDDGAMEISRDGETRRISLRQGRAMITMLNGIEALLAGDTTVLQQIFATRVTGSDDGWNLELLPESRRMQKQLDRISVTGNADAITSIRFELANGERNLLRLGSRDIETCVPRNEDQ